MKYFVVSDIHSFIKNLKSSLRLAGFDKKNKEHILVCAGDFFDRGESAVKTYNFIQSIPKSRCILIRGNHEKLLLDLLEKDYPEDHDFHNCTVDTVCEIAGMQYLEDDKTLVTAKYLKLGYSNGYDEYGDIRLIDEEFKNLWSEIKQKAKASKIISWLNSSEWRNYYEIDKYIIVHAFIPLTDDSKLPSYYLNGHNYKYIENWRELDNNSAYWVDATWGCPHRLYSTGLFDEEIKKNKILVCGHWNAGDFYAKLDDNFEYYHNCSPIYAKHNIIAIDGGCGYDYKTNSLVHPQNVLIIDENFDCFDKFGNKLLYNNI